MSSEEKKVNINTIAKLAKVSTTTVSNYINATEVFPISDETKARINKVMRELNYRPHIGGSLIRRKQNLPEKVCFIFGPNPELPVFDVIQIPLLGWLMRDLSVNMIEKLGMSLEVRCVQDEKCGQDWNELLLDVGYVINYEPLNSILHDLLQRKNIPLLELSTAGVIQFYDPTRFPIPGVNPGNLSESVVQADHVHWNIRKQTMLMMDYIHDYGCRNVLMVPSWNIKANRKEFYGMDAEEKIEGFMEGLKKYPDMAGDVLHPPMPGNYDMYYEMRHTYETLMQMPEKLRGIDAIVSHNDIVAQGVVAALNAIGIVPGRDVLVTGEGDFREFRHATPSIVTSGCDRELCIAEICRLLSRRKESPDADYLSIEIPSRVIEHGHMKQDKSIEKVV